VGQLVAQRGHLGLCRVRLGQERAELRVVAAAGGGGRGRAALLRLGRGGDEGVSHEVVHPGWPASELIARWNFAGRCRSWLRDGSFGVVKSQSQMVAEKSKIFSAFNQVGAYCQI